MTTVETPEVVSNDLKPIKASTLSVLSQVDGFKRIRTDEELQALVAYLDSLKTASPVKTAEARRAH